MKAMLPAATIALSLMASPAFAASPYNVIGNPFPFGAPTASVAATPPASDTGSQSYQSSGPVHALPVVGNQVLPTNGSDGIVQTANSLPSGFDSGPAAYAGNHSAGPYAQAAGVQSR